MAVSDHAARASCNEAFNKQRRVSMSASRQASTLPASTQVVEESSAGGALVGLDTGASVDDNDGYEMIGDSVS